MNKYKRVFLVVMDSFGIGNAKDAREYGDEGANTFEAITRDRELNLPNMELLGFGNFGDVNLSVNKQIAHCARLDEVSNGKDTLTGHWEFVGIKTIEPFVTFTDTGFPKELLDQLSARTGREIVGNKAASGTEILDEFGEHHMKTGDLIVYTSTDSVLQICGHEETMGVDELWKVCEVAREICNSKPEWKVGRIIARPFIGGKAGSFKRTANRRDYAVVPPQKTTLNFLKNAGYDVVSVGKINDIFSGEGITRKLKGKTDEDNMQITIDLANENFEGLVFTNLVDFDALYGHRRDILGYAKNTELFDVKLGELIDVMNDDDLLIITADHGNDPSFEGSDHTREQVPLIIYAKDLVNPRDLGEFTSFATIGNLVATIFNVEKCALGEDILL